MSEDATWSAGERILQEAGLLEKATSTTPSKRDELPLKPEHLDTAALRTLTGRIVICRMHDIALHSGDDDQHRLTTDAWIAADWTIPLEDWQ